MLITSILPPVITPFNTNGDVDYDTFVRNIERWNTAPLSGYLVLGSNSETPYLSEEEKLKLIELTVQSAKKNRIILAGTGLESTGETIKLTNKAAKLGAHAALVLTPSYYGEQMTDRALIHHFTVIAETSEIPILIYNVPKFTHLNISVEAVKVLSQQPNIIGMKDSLGDIAQLETFKKVASSDFNLIAGSASTWYPALKLGIRAGILALANCLPNECVEVQQLFEQGEFQKAQNLQAKLVPVNKDVTDTYGVAGLKCACSLMGYEGGFVRSPLLSLTDKEKANIRQVLDRAGVFNRKEILN
ncbi:MAG: dihydrodipicolinate synthase family protein [Ignavibacteriae bacterium]|nr:dihydrodipicolinate synthase family protein [Ignavibacteriota bacterium]